MYIYINYYGNNGRRRLLNNLLHIEHIESFIEFVLMKWLIFYFRGLTLFFIIEIKFSL